MIPITQEQQTIIGHDLEPGKILKIIAFAGTGKTTTLVEYARARPRTRFLYLAFNKSVQTEAARKFPANVMARTSHALAFREKGFKHKDRLVPGFRADQVKAALSLGTYEAARFAIDTLLNYLVSADPKVDSCHIPIKARAFYQNAGTPLPDLVDLANRLGRFMCDGTDKRIGMLHDGYLKLYQLSNPVLNVDCILLDEAQDINPVTAAIVFSQARSATGKTPRNHKPSSIILVGDCHQQIYSFRGAKDTLESVKSDHTLYLTGSFRFDSNVARAANMVLSRFKGEKHPIRGIPVHGLNKSKWDPHQHTIIARTNAALFGKAAALFKKNKIGFLGGVEGYRLHLLKEVFLLHKRDQGLIRDPYIRSFDSFSDMMAYAGAVEDRELLTLGMMVKEYGGRIPLLVDQITQKAADPSKAEILLTTAHKSKGLEWANVLLMDDFHPLIKEGRPVDPKGIEPDEFNLIYVAMTRAMVNLRFDKKSDIPLFIQFMLKKGKNGKAPGKRRLEPPPE